ncbi:MAG: hypothetical protein EA387_07780 [Nitriliruptor sp.]|nr:MAG: hypothetical protein EA387_07780 [Nitriliruptor sp.]
MPREAGDRRRQQGPDQRDEVGVGGELGVVPLGDERCAQAPHAVDQPVGSLWTVHRQTAAGGGGAPTRSHVDAPAGQGLHGEQVAARCRRHHRRACDRPGPSCGPSGQGPELDGGAGLWCRLA